MEKTIIKKICLVFNHFQLQDGVCRSAIAIANLLSERNDVVVTLIPLYRYHKKALAYLSPKVMVKPMFRIYFKGLSSLVNKISPKLIYNWFIGDKYDVNIAFQYSKSPIIAAGAKQSHLSITWMHIYDEGLRYISSYRKMDKLVTVSKCNAIKLEKELQENIYVDYCYNPIDDRDVRKQGSMPIPLQRPNNFLFVSVARMSPEKGYGRLLDCVKRLKDDGYEFSLWLVGDGPQLKELQDKASILGVCDIVTFIGRQDNPHSYTSKADVYVCSSTLEGYSTSCTEALMLNIPVISTDVSGAREIIKEAGCGLVCADDENALYSMMKYTLDNPKIVNKWKEALSISKENFSPRKRFEKFLDIVELPH